MLSGSKLPKSFWAEALAAAVYVKNRSPANSLKDKTHYEALFDLKPSVKHFKTFGCICFLHIPKDERQKLNSKSSRGVFIGYASESKAYRVYDPVKKRTVMARDVEFNESDLFNFDWDHESILVGGETYVTLPLSSCLEEAEDVEEQIVRKFDREKKQPDRLADWAYFLNELHEPETVQEACVSPESVF